MPKIEEDRLNIEHVTVDGDVWDVNRKNYFMYYDKDTLIGKRTHPTEYKPYSVCSQCGSLYGGKYNDPEWTDIRVVLDEKDNVIKIYDI